MYTFQEIEKVELHCQKYNTQKLDDENHYLLKYAWLFNLISY